MFEETQFAVCVTIFLYVGVVVRVLTVYMYKGWPVRAVIYLVLFIFTVSSQPVGG